MSEIIPVASVEPNGTIIFYRPIRVGNLEIEPSNGGVLENGVPYQAGGGSGEIFLSSRYKSVPAITPANWVIGSSTISATVDLSTAPRFAFVLTPISGTVQPTPGGPVDDFNVKVTVNNIANMATFADGIYAYTNLYNGYKAQVSIDLITPTGISSAEVDITVVFSMDMNQTTSWISPGDCMWFMEFF